MSVSTTLLPLRAEQCHAAATRRSSDAAMTALIAQCLCDDPCNGGPATGHRDDSDNQQEAPGWPTQSRNSSLYFGSEPSTPLTYQLMR
jgi:hypothetical protein